MYGGLGKVGLDYQGKKGQENLLDPNESGDNEDEDQYQIPAFSEQAKHLIRAKQVEKSGADPDWEDQEECLDEEMLFEGLE